VAVGNRRLKLQQGIRRRRRRGRRIVAVYCEIYAEHMNTRAGITSHEMEGFRFEFLQGKILFSRTAQTGSVANSAAYSVGSRVLISFCYRNSE
jgi:hypothetical protein